MRYGFATNARHRLAWLVGLSSGGWLLLHAATLERPVTTAGTDTEFTAPASTLDTRLAKADNGNPYLRLIPRNAFGIQPPPVERPIPPTVVSNPPVQLPLFVTGFSFLKGVKKVYLVVNRPGSKAPDYITAVEGEEFDGFQVVSIEPKKKTVTVLNAGVEVVLDFDRNGMKPAAGSPAPGGPGGVPAPIPNPRVLSGGGTGGGPTVIGRNTGGSGVITVGAASQPTAMDPRNRGGLDSSTPAGTYSPPPQPDNGARLPVPVQRTRPAPASPPLPGG